MVIKNYVYRTKRIISFLPSQKNSTLRQKWQQIQKTPITRVCVVEVPIIPLFTQKSHKALCPRFVSLTTITSGECRDLRGTLCRNDQNCCIFFFTAVVKQTPKLDSSRFFLIQLYSIPRFCFNDYLYILLDLEMYESE